ncbi:MAG: BrnT family toxin [Proteobacteria bacterium]|nr:BrnT family toxin [Pseudomonadota bacterium]MBU4389423.1 BrnT family toxin [Pseudomonadota bacterium]MCG2830576.1 BrnT family toxin [Desulfobacteraceae bacterium]
MRYYFEWDPSKANENLQKHKISFERAATIFLDPHAISIFDKEHSQDADRWITIGINSSGILLVIVHTFRRIDALSCSIRIISARKATKRETRQYKKENL